MGSLLGRISSIRVGIGSCSRIGVVWAAMVGVGFGSRELQQRRGGVGSSIGMGGEDFGSCSCRGL